MHVWASEKHSAMKFNIATFMLLQAWKLYYEK